MTTMPWGFYYIEVVGVFINNNIGPQIEIEYDKKKNTINREWYS